MGSVTHFRPIHRSVRLAVLAGLIVLVLLVRLGWGWWAGRQFAAELERLRERGEPAALDEIQYKAVPDDQNAVILFDQAAQAISVDSPRQLYGPGVNLIRLPPRWHALAEASERGNAAAFLLARKARGHAAAQFRDSVYATKYPLNRMSQLAALLFDGALHAHFGGHHDESIQRILDLLHLARALRRDDMLLMQRVGIIAERLACEALIFAASDPRFAAHAGKPPVREAIQTLIRELLKEEIARDGFAQTLRNLHLVSIEEMREHGGQVWFLRPLAEQEAIRLLRNIDPATQAARAEPHPSALEALARSEQRPHSAWRVDYSRWFDPYGTTYVLSHVIELHFSSIAECRVAALALCIGLFRTDHGRWPESLEELSPQYIESIPKNPFRRNEAIAYTVLKGGRPDGGDRRLLSYGAIDPGSPRASGFQYGGNDHDTATSGRRYRDLVRFVAKGVDGNPEEADAPGHEQ